MTTRYEYRIELNDENSPLPRNIYYSNVQDWEAANRSAENTKARLNSGGANYQIVKIERFEITH